MADSQHIDLSYVDTALNKATSRDLIDATTGVTSHSVATQLIKAASARVDGALEAAGYPIPGSSPPALVKDATLGQYLVRAYGRKGLTLPDRWHEHVHLVDAIAEGETTVPGLTPDSEKAVGRVWFSDSSDTNGKPRVYDKKLRTHF